MIEEILQFLFRHEKSHEYDQSLNCLQRSLEIDPNNETIKLKMANIKGILQKVGAYLFEFKKRNKKLFLKIS